MAAALHLPYPPTPPPVPPTSARVVAFNRVSEAEYLALDAASDWKLEYLDGEVIPRGGGTVTAMAAASVSHNLIADNTLGALLVLLRGKPCRPFGSDLRLYVEPLSRYFYADITVVCGERQLKTDQQPASLLNPVLIVEVLSDSTTAYDRGRKFRAYQAIASLRYYLLLDSQQVGADL